MTDMSTTDSVRAEPAESGDLDPVEVRVLGCLVEKESTTPGSYPLTLNGLRNACNQSSSRDPVLDLSEHQVQSALLSLRDRRLARPVRNPGDRVTKFRHAVPEVLEVDPAELAALSVLMLRGPQTLGEVRTRTTRQHDFPDTAAVGEVLAGLASREPPMVAVVPRGPGQKEDRWTHLLGDATLDVRTDDQPGSDAPAAVQSIVQAVGGIAATWVAGARAVLAALDQQAVSSAWDRPSVLADQAVSSLAGHLARGGVWVVGDYLAGDVPTGEADIASAAAYVDDLVSSLTDDDHRGIRDRGAAVAAVGHPHLVRTLRSRLEELAPRVGEESPDRLVAVFGGLTIRFEDYLVTRVVEQVVHLDDLARSIDGATVEVPGAARALADALGLEVLRRRHGDDAVTRVLYRREFRDLVPLT